MNSRKEIIRAIEDVMLRVIMDEAPAISNATTKDIVVGSAPKILQKMVDMNLLVPPVQALLTQSTDKSESEK
jgi:hypothetical protein